MSSKKNYQPPQITLHGNVTSITRKGGTSFSDVPAGASDIALAASGTGTTT